jgi:hypothetical protein
VGIYARYYGAWREPCQSLSCEQAQAIANRFNLFLPK